MGGLLFYRRGRIFIIISCEEEGGDEALKDFKPLLKQFFLKAYIEVLTMESPLLKHLSLSRLLPTAT